MVLIYLIIIFRGHFKVCVSDICKIQRRQQDDCEDVIEDMNFLTSEEKTQMTYEEDQNDNYDDDDHQCDRQDTETRQLVMTLMFLLLSEQ